MSDISPELAEALTKMARAAARMMGAPEPEYIVICRGDTSMPEEQKENPRDTQFKGFAKLLLEELPDCPIDNSRLGIATGEWMEAMKHIIARRAYDLVLHALWYSTPANGSTIKEYRGLTVGEIANLIPDLKEWPKEGEK